MSRRREHTIVAPATSPLVMLDHRKGDYQASIFIDSLAGSATWTVQVTADEVMATGYDPSTGNWQDLTDMTGLTGSAKGHLAYPACGLQVTTSGTGVIRLVVIEGGADGGRR